MYEAFFAAGLSAAISVELISASRSMKGISCEHDFLASQRSKAHLLIIADVHIYGAYNLFYGVGSSSELIHCKSESFILHTDTSLLAVGPIVAGQVCLQPAPRYGGTPTYSLIHRVSLSLDL